MSIAEMTRSIRVAQAASNNAIWCDTIGRAQGSAGELHEHCWVQRCPAPRFYPNIVTRSAVALAEQLRAVQDLIEEGLLPGFAAKDSFATLDLKPLGLDLLFEASWIWRDSAQPQPAVAARDLRWAIVQTAAELADWEDAWAGDPEAEMPQPRVFLPALLADPTLRFIGASRGKQIVAGGIANRTGAVVGISNVFVRAGDVTSSWASCIAMAMAAFPGLPLVGYERGEAFILAQQLGFKAIGPLRVWAYTSHIAERGAEQD